MDECEHKNTVWEFRDEGNPRFADKCSACGFVSQVMDMEDTCEVLESLRRT